MFLAPGELVGRYRIVAPLGGGGMGVVYHAFDTRLERAVALKVLRPEAVGDAAARERFLREARAASALRHPHAVTVHDVDTLTVEGDSIDVIVMELVDGEPLDRLLARGPLPVAEALRFAEQIAGALGAAHAAGLVHRDVKPGNVIVDGAGNVRVVDFGLAKPAPRDAGDLEGPTVAGGLTGVGALVGTPGYMSPEQVEGRPLDARSDVFAAGTVIYEMLAGERAFRGPTQVATLLAVVRDTPPPLSGARRGVPPSLVRIVERCLHKEPAARYASGAELAGELARAREELVPAPPASLAAALRRPRVAMPLLAALLALLALGGWTAQREWRRRQARRVELPRLAQLIADDRMVEAYALARRLRSLLPGDPELERAWQRASVPASVLSDPPGATAELRGYLDADGPWIEIGTTPIAEARVPFAHVRWRLRKEGFHPLEAAPPGEDTAEGRVRFAFTLSRVGASPAGMVRVPAGTSAPTNVPPAEVAPFWIDRHEVTNAEYQRFVDDGGYRRRELWRQPFVDAGRELSWEEAMRRCRDATGRPGPASWQLGAFPAGRGALPVGGVSWYEAAAYARWAGKELPTFYHWWRAAQQDVFSEIVLASNFTGHGPAAVGRHRGVGPFGTFDMAGNVHEWCWNEAPGSRRFLAGGAWDEPSYTYAEPSLAAPLLRRPSYGFRLVRYDAAPPPPQLATIRARTERDYAREPPLRDDVFAAYRGLYGYERGPLRAKVERVDESGAYRHERVSFAAAYGGERVAAHLFLPRRPGAPLQVVVYFPDSVSEALGSSDELVDRRWWEFLVRSGRAVLYPVYKGTYERRVTSAGRPSPAERRNLVIQWSKDLGRALDYLETRPEVAPGKVAYFGFSMGANYGPVMLANEPRLATAVLLGGGLHGRVMAPEIDPFHFAPRVRVPVLMLNGRDDFIRPVATSQRPLFEALGTPPELKRHVLFPGGHLPPSLEGIMGETLAWLDRHLGEVPPPARPR